MVVGHGPTALAVGAVGGCLDIFILIYPFSSLSPFLWETARYRLSQYTEYIEILSQRAVKPKTTNQSIIICCRSSIEKNSINNKG